MLRIPLCLDSRLTDGGKVVSLTHRPCSTPQELCFLLLVRLKGLSKLKKLNDLIKTRNCYLRACSVAPQPSALLRPHRMSVCYSAVILSNGIISQRCYLHFLRTSSTHFIRNYFSRPLEMCKFPFYGTCYSW
jgi:hypothetical protein